MALVPCKPKPKSFDRTCSGSNITDIKTSVQLSLFVKMQKRGMKS